MDSESSLSGQSSPVQEGPTGSFPPNAVKLKPIAPAWHTVVILAAILLNSYAGRPSAAPIVASTRAQLLVYAITFVFELALVLFIWFGISRKGVKMRDLIGGRWAKPEDFLVDLGIAVGFWVVSTVLRGALAIGLHLIDIHNPQGQLDQVKRAASQVTPHNSIELVFFLLLVIFAGIFEEIIFRGYLQQQLGAIGRNIWIGVILSAVVFGAGHGYQGSKQMVIIGIYGAMFGVLAVLRKNLRPGMIAHSGQDALSGLLLFFMT